MQMIFGVGPTLAYLSQVFTLEPGDLVFTGTPPGVGMVRKPPIFLKGSDGLTKIAAEHGIDEQALETARIWRNARYTELLRAGECVVIEDSDRGLRAALAAGLRCIVIPQGLTRGLDFTGALRQLTDIRQVPPLIHELMQT